MIGEPWLSLPETDLDTSINRLVLPQVWQSQGTPVGWLPHQVIQILERQPLQEVLKTEIVVPKQVFELEKGQNPANIPVEDEQKVAVNLPAQRLSCFISSKVELSSFYA